MRIVFSVILLAASTFRPGETSDPSQPCRDLCERAANGCAAGSDCLSTGVCSNLFWEDGSRSVVVHSVNAGLVSPGPEVTCQEAISRTAVPHDMSVPVGAKRHAAPTAEEGRQNRPRVDQAGGAESEAVSPSETPAEPSTNALRRSRRSLAFSTTTASPMTDSRPTRRRRVSTETPPVSNPVAPITPSRQPSENPAYGFAASPPSVSLLDVPLGASSTASLETPVDDSDRFRTPPRPVSSAGPSNAPSLQSRLPRSGQTFPRHILWEGPSIPDASIIFRFPSHGFVGAPMSLIGSSAPVPGSVSDVLESDSAWFGVHNEGEIRAIVRQVSDLLTQQAIPQLLNFPFGMDELPETSVTDRLDELMRLLASFMEPGVAGLDRARNSIATRVTAISRWRRAINIMMGTLMNMGSGVSSRHEGFARAHLVAICSLRNVLGGRVFMREIPRVWSSIIPGIEGYISTHAATLPETTTETTASAASSVRRGLLPTMGDTESEEEEEEEAPSGMSDVADPAAPLLSEQFNAAVRGRHLALSCPICNAFNTRQTRPANMTQLARLIVKQFALAQDVRRVRCGDWDTKRVHITEHLETFLEMFASMISSNTAPETIDEICSGQMDAIFQFLGRYVMRDENLAPAVSRRYLAVARRCMPHLTIESRERVVARLLQTAAPEVTNTLHSARRLRVSQNLTDAHAFAETMDVLGGLDKLDLVGGDIEVGYRDSVASGNGPRTAWITSNIRRAFHPSSQLFVFSDDRNAFMRPAFLPTAGDRAVRLARYRQVGRLIGLAIATDVPLGISITSAMASYLSMGGWETTEIRIETLTEWLRQEDPELVQRLATYRMNPETLYGGFTPFSNDPEEERVVNQSNVNEFFDYQFTFIARDSITVQLNAILRGIYDVLPFPHFGLFNATEISRIFRGPEEIDVANLKQSTTYVYGSVVPSIGRNPGNQVIRWIWQALESFTQEELAQFLMFVSGTDVAPLHGFTGPDGTGNWLQINLDPSRFGRSPRPSPARAVTVTAQPGPSHPAAEGSMEVSRDHDQDDEESDDEAYDVPEGWVVAATGEAVQPTASPFNHNRLPHSQTCFRQLIVGYFDSYELLRQRLLAAIVFSTTLENA
jgi:hypothetical protein